MKLNKMVTAALAVVMAFGMAACSSQEKNVEITQENISKVVENAAKKLDDTNESIGKLSLTMALSSGEDSSVGTTVAEITDRKEPVLKYVKAVSSQDGVENETALEFYIEETDDVHTLYTPYEGVWYNQDITDYETGYIFSQYYLTENASALLSNTSGHTLEEEEDGIYKVSCVIPTDKLYTVVDESGVFNYVFEGLSESYFNVENDTDVVLYFNGDGNLVKYEIDYTGALGDVIKSIYAAYGEALSENTLSVDEYSVVVEITEYESIGDFSIPEDVKASKKFDEVGDVTVVE